MKAYNKKRRPKNSIKNFKRKSETEEIIFNSMFRMFEKITEPTEIKRKRPFPTCKLLSEEIHENIDLFNQKFEKTNFNNAQRYNAHYHLIGEYALSYITGELYFPMGKYGIFEVAIIRNGRMLGDISRGYNYKGVRRLAKHLSKSEANIINFVKKTRWE